MIGRVSCINVGEYAMQLHYPRKPTPTCSNRRFLLLGPSPTPGAFRPTIAHGSIVDGAIRLDKGCLIDADLFARLASAVAQ